MTIAKIAKRAIADNDYQAHITKLFGTHFTMSLEPHIFDAARNLSAEYGGGTWDFFALSNGGFFMSPRLCASFNVSLAFDEPVNMSAEGLGIAACLYAFSRLSFGTGAFAELCGRQYYLLRAFMFEHLEAPTILCATD